ncbi:redoxin domain-containing protein [bacterium]|nr:redoxin domain-containing protein [bacterium]
MAKRSGILALAIIGMGFVSACSSGPGGLPIVAPVGGGDLATLTTDGGANNLSGTVVVRLVLDEAVSVTTPPILLVDGLNQGPMVATPPGSNTFTFALDTSVLSNAVPHILQSLYAPLNIARELIITVFNLTPSSSLNIAAPLSGSVVKGSTVIQVSYPPSLDISDLDYFINGAQIDIEGAEVALSLDGVPAAVVVTVDDCSPFQVGQDVRVMDNFMAGSGTISTVVSCVTGPPDILTIADPLAEAYQVAQSARAQILGHCPDGGTADASSDDADYALPFCIWDASTASPGSTIITVVGIHSSGTATASVVVTVQSPGGTADLTPPTIAFVNPGPDDVVSGSANLRVIADDDHGISSVSFLYRPAGGGSPTPIGNAVRGTGSNWSLAWDTLPLVDGAYEVLGIATDFSSNSGLSIQPVIVDNTGGAGDVNVDPPCVEILNPKDTGGGTPVVAGTVTLLSKAPLTLSENPACGDRVNIAKVEYFLDGVLLGTSTNSAATYAFQWSTTQGNNGSFDLSAVATDTDGNTSPAPVCGPVTFTACLEVDVDNGTGDFIPPVVTIDDPLTGQIIAGQYTIIATATDNVGVLKVEFFANGVLIPGCIDTNLNDGANCFWDTETYPSGGIELTAIATDTSGNRAFSPVVSVSVVKSLPPELLTRESDIYVSQYNILNPQPISIVVNSTAIDNNSPPEGITYTWNFGDGAGFGIGCCGTYTYLIFDPLAPNYLVELRISNESGFTDTDLPDGSTHFFFIATAQQIWDLQGVTESEACELDWPSPLGDPPCTPSAEPPRESTIGQSIVIRNLATALAQSVADDDYRGKVVVLQFFQADSQIAEGDMINHFRPYFESPDFDASAVELVSIGLNTSLSGGTPSFADVGELANWANSRGFGWTFVFDQNNTVHDMYVAVFDVLGGTQIPQYIFLDRNHYVEFVDFDSLDELLPQGQPFGDFIEGLAACFANPTCTPTF